jgi:hypothetical protein
MTTGNMSGPERFAKFIGEMDEDQRGLVVTAADLREDVIRLIKQTRGQNVDHGLIRLTAATIKQKLNDLNRNVGEYVQNYFTPKPQPTTEDIGDQTNQVG